MVMQYIFPLNSPSLHGNGDLMQYWDISLAAKKSAIFIDSNHSRVSEALLFQAAVSACTELKRVTLICAQQLNALHPSVHGMPRPQPAAMAHLNILYLKDQGQLMSYLSKLHITGPPDVLVINNLEHYIPSHMDDHRKHDMARLCATICDAATYMNQKSDGQSMVIAGACDNDRNVVDVYKRFFSFVYAVTQGEENSNEFEVTHVSPETAHKLRFSAYHRDEQIYLKDIQKLENTIS